MVWNENTDSHEHQDIYYWDKKNPENAVTSKILNMMEAVKDI